MAEYDATLKALVEVAPADWLSLLDRPRRPARVIDTDLATVLGGAADKVIRVGGRRAYLVHLEFQTGHDASRLPARLALYNAVLDYRHTLPVLSVAVLLTPDADSPGLTGLLERALPGEEPYKRLRYQVVRVWQLPAERLLAGGLATLPLAPISDVGPAGVASIVRQVREKLPPPGTSRQADDLWLATFVFLGMRYQTRAALALLPEIDRMKESATYQSIVAEGLQKGREQEARAMVLLAGTRRFGPPDDAARAVVEAVTDPVVLEGLMNRLFDVDGWPALVAELPRPARRRRGNGAPRRG